MSSPEHTSEVVCSSEKDSPRVVLERFEVGPPELNGEVNQDMIDVVDQNSYSSKKETEENKTKEEDCQEREHEHGSSEGYSDAQECFEVRENKDSSPDADETTGYHDEEEEEEEEEEEDPIIWKCQGRNTWCYGFCLPFRVTGTSVISDGQVNVLRVYCTEAEKAEVGREQHCVFAMNLWRNHELKRRWFAREGSVRRRESVERMREERRSLRVKLPMWKRSLVYSSSPLGWDDGFWREGL